VKINDISSRPIPPSGITRISLWRHGMGRHQIVSRSEFGRVIDTIIDLNSSLYADHIIMPSEQIICFNIRADIPIAEFGYIHGAAGNHKDIKFPELANAPLTGMIAPSMKETEPPWITLSTVNTDELEGNTEEELFSKYVSAARFLSENNMPFETMLVRGLINDLAFLNDACDMRLFTTPIKTLGDLARQALPQDADLNNVLSFPAPPVFEHCENHPDKKCSFGFNILHPAKFPYPAQAVSIAIRTFLGSRSWDPKKIDTVLEPLKLPSKDGERVIHITAKEISGSRTELSFCIRRPLEHESTAPIKGRIIFRE